jgi:2-iminobutanoate/2-iminopropanoate deaminase
MGQVEGVFTPKAPKPLPQFSQAVKYNDMVYCSGNIGLDPETWKLVDGSIKDRTVRQATVLEAVRAKMLIHLRVHQRQALKNLSAVLEEAGSSLKNVVKVNIFITNMDNFATMNEGWDEFFTWEPKPVRSTPSYG